MIVEGFLLFYDAAICQMLDACIWLETDMDRCAIRRSARSKKKSKAGFTRFQQWYEHEVWVSFQQYRTVQLTNARYALKIDGALDLATISRQAAEHIEHSVEAARSADERRKHSRRGTAAPIGDAAAQRALLSAPTPPTARPEKKRRTVPSRKQADRSPRRRAGRFSHTSSPPTRWKSGAASADCRIQRSAARPHGDLAPSDGTRGADPRGLRRRPPADADTATDPTEGIPAWRAEADARRAAADAPYWDWVAAQRLAGGRRRPEAEEDDVEEKQYTSTSTASTSISTNTSSAGTSTSTKVAPRGSVADQATPKPRAVVIVLVLVRKPNAGWAYSVVAAVTQVGRIQL